MVYSSDAAKWKAYEFSDPFATGSFFVCNKINKFFCRPDCDARPTTNLKSEIKFVDDLNAAVNYGFVPCEHCDPIGVPSVDVTMLIDCVGTINKEIGFVRPLGEDEEVNNEEIKASILGRSLATSSDYTTSTSNANRRSSVPVVNFLGKPPKDAPLSKNDSDHYRLVDLACRHLALAAASNLSAPKRKPSAEDNDKKKRRRGGVLGFKELAAKSKLSAWHFHRVFKSVTGLTPKTYGDRCWEFIKSRRAGATANPTNTTANLLSTYTENTAPISRKRRGYSSDPVSPSYKRQMRESVSPSHVKVKMETNSPEIHHSNNNLAKLNYNMTNIPKANTVQQAINGVTPTSDNLLLFEKSKSLFEREEEEEYMSPFGLFSPSTQDTQITSQTQDISPQAGISPTFDISPLLSTGIWPQQMQVNNVTNSQLQPQARDNFSFDEYNVLDYSFPSGAAYTVPADEFVLDEDWSQHLLATMTAGAGTGVNPGGESSVGYENHGWTAEVLSANIGL